MPIATPSTAATSGVSQARQHLDEREGREFFRLAAGVEKVSEIVARRERAARAGKHDGADRRIAAGLPQSLRRRHVHGAGQRVLFLRPVEGHAQDRIIALDPDVWASPVIIGQRHARRHGPSPRRA